MCTLRFYFIVIIAFWYISCSSQTKGTDHPADHTTGGNLSSVEAVIKDVFIDGEMTGTYSGGVSITEGTIKIGDNFTVSDEEGHQKAVTVLELENYSKEERKVTEMHSGEVGFIVFQTQDKRKWSELSGSIYFGKIPMFSETENEIKDVICTIDGNSWSGILGFKTAQYFPKGNKIIGTKEPYFIMTFHAVDKSDSRNLIIQSRSFKSGIGLKSVGSYEVAVLGSSDGDKNKTCIQSNWERGRANTKNTHFHFEISKWEEKGNFVLVSGKFSGELQGLNFLGIKCPNIKITNGKFSDLMVEIN